MSVVDTSVWSLYLPYKNRPEPEVALLKQLIREGQIQMLGIIRQKLLSGIKEIAQFEKLQRVLEGFPNLLATDQDHLVAAQFYNMCSTKGVQGSSVDFLICAQAVNGTMPILTMDKDFKNYAKLLPIKFFK